MKVQLSLGNHLQHAPHCAVGNATPDIARADATRLPQLRLGTAVGVALEEVARPAHPGRPQPGIPQRRQRSIGPVHCVALIWRGKHAGPTGHGFRMGIGFDRSHLAGQLGGTDNVDAR